MRSTIFIIVDNLRVGGVQRLALDEAYALSLKNYEVEILLLEKEHDLDNMREIDAEFFSSFNIKITSVAGKTWKKIIYVLSKIRDTEVIKAISHSAKGVAILRISFLLCIKRMKIQAIFINQFLCPMRFSALRDFSSSL